MAFPHSRRPQRGNPLDIGPLLRRRWTFSSLWGLCLPLSIAAISGAILLSGGDAERRPMLVFGAGVLIGLMGLASLFAGLIEAGSRERARRAARAAARADAPGPAPRAGKGRHVL